MSSLEIEILTLLRSERNFLFSILKLSPVKLFEKVGKFSVGRHNKLKSDFSAFKLNLFSVFKSNVTLEFEEIFLKMS